MIDLIKAELQSGSYSENDQEALTQLKLVQIIEQGELAAGDKVKLLSLTPNLQARLSAGASNDAAVSFGVINTTIGAICLAALKNIESQSDDIKLKMYDYQTTAMINVLFGAGILTQGDIDALHFLADIVVKPFERATLRDVIEARGGGNSLQVAWAGQRYLKITVSNLSEQVSPLITISNTLFDGEPIGRTVSINKNGSLVVDLNGLSSKIVGATTMTVQMWVPCTFSVELI